MGINPLWFIFYSFFIHFTDFNTLQLSQGKGKGTVHPRRGHKGPDGKDRNSSTLPLTSALDGGGWSRPLTSCFTPRGKNRYPLYRRLGGPQTWSRQVRTVSPPPTGIGSPDHPASSEVLYQLRYPGSYYHSLGNLIQFAQEHARNFNCHTSYTLVFLLQKFNLVQALRLCTGRTAHRGSSSIGLPFLDHGTRRGWGISFTPRPIFTPGKDPVPIVQEAGRSRGGMDRRGKSRRHRYSIPGLSRL